MDASDDLLDGEPPTIDPYEVLGLERTATADQVKSAYRKLALKNHPDKVSEGKKTEAHAIFQSIAFAYAVLSDPTRRKRYDETGSTSESIVDADGFSWSDFYREQFCDAISSDAIAKFEAQYKGSDEERDDILVAYEEHEGDMDAIYEHVMLSNVLKDDERFRSIIDEAIASEDVPAFKTYTKESKKSKQARIKVAKDEANEAEEYAKELGVHDKLFGKKGEKDKKGKKKGDEDALAALIQRRGQDRKQAADHFLDNLAAKYGAGATTSSAKSGKKRRAEPAEEPSEEAFQAAAAKLKMSRK
ncbi:DnaJ domain-containing protein [Xylariaceae sp. FL1272]|nr:DnaJ domain-containing protein [Xylariaceae sp. FL1272]